MLPFVVNSAKLCISHEIHVLIKTILIRCNISKDCGLHIAYHKVEYCFLTLCCQLTDSLP